MSRDDSTKRIINIIEEKLSPEAQKGVAELLASEDLHVDKKALGDLLRSLDRPAGFLGLPKYNPPDSMNIRSGTDQLLIQYLHYILKTDEGKELTRKLKEDPLLATMKGKMLNTGDGGSGVDRDYFAMWYAWAQNEYGNEEAQSRWESYLNSSSITVTQALWILGVKVDEQIQLTKNALLTPISDMPESRNKESFQRYNFDPGAILNMRSSKPEVAITIQTSVPKLRSRSKNQTASKNQDLLWDLSLLLNLLPNISCTPYYSTSYIPPETPPGFFLTGSSGSCPTHDVIGNTVNKLTLDMLNGFEYLTSAFLTLEPKEKTKYEHALSRLSLAKRREKIEDKILDLTIAQEMVLLDGNTDQLAFAFRLRGSWLIANSPAERIEIHDALSKLYTYRCQVAHTGVLEKNNPAKMKHVRESFPQYVAIAEKIIQKLIIDGKPDWKELLLGAKD